jgi:hypothetical protein
MEMSDETPLNAGDLIDAHDRVWREINPVHSDDRVQAWLRLSIKHLESLYRATQVVKSEREIAKHEAAIEEHRKVIAENTL